MGEILVISCWLNNYDDIITGDYNTGDIDIVLVMMNNGDIVLVSTWRFRPNAIRRSFRVHLGLVFGLLSGPRFDSSRIGGLIPRPLSGPRPALPGKGGFIPGEDDPERFQGGGFKPNLKPFGFRGGALKPETRKVSGLV